MARDTGTCQVGRVVSPFFEQANVTMTARHQNVKDDYLQELIKPKPLALVKS